MFKKIKTSLIILISLIGFQSCQYYKAVQFPREETTTGFFSLVERPGNIAHRGASGAYPENTILAFRKGFQKGSTAIELDVWMTADNEVVVIHDATLDRTTNGSGKVSDFTLEEIQQLDAAYRFKPEAEYPFRGMGVRIPTLREVLDSFPDKAVLIEIKAGGLEVATEVAKVVKATNAHDRVLLASFRERTLKMTSRQLPGVPRTAASGEAFRFYMLAHVGIAGFINWDFDGLFIPPAFGKLPVLTTPVRNAARAAGLQTYVWTINDNDEMMKYVLLSGVDGILTDYPDVLQAIIDDLEERSTIE